MRTIAELGEFGLIDRIRGRAGSRRASGVVIGIGDDAAVLRARGGEDVVLSTDACVEGVHFDWSIQTARAVGRRALVANLSDLAAMGARPLGFTCAMSAPPSLPLRRFDDLLGGMLEEASAHGCPLVGGNLTRSRQLQISIAVVGAVRRGHALRRDALRPGDRLFVTGDLGRGVLDRLRAQAGRRRARHVPAPRIEAGRALARMRACRVCIDISDGLAGDALHLAEASGVGLEIDASRLPLPRGYARACAALGRDPVALAASGGEDYELLFALRPGAPGASEAALARRLGVTVTEIGSATRTPGLRGLPVEAGWRHW